jgi:outer membrane usher protein
VSVRALRAALLAALLVPARAYAQASLPAAATATTGATAVPAILAFSLNGTERGEIYVYLEGSTVLARTEDLRAAGLGSLLGPRRLFEGLEYVSLSTLDPPVAVQLDEKEMTLRLEVDPRVLPLTRLDLGVSEAPEDMVLGDDTSLFANYAAHWNATEGSDNYDGYFEAGMSRGAWLLYSSAMLDRDTRARGLSNLTFDDRDRLRRFVIGDAVAAGDSLGGSALIGGVQLARSFELDPYRVVRPTLGQAGVVRSPSTAEIYVNGVLVRRATLPPGPFSASDLPVTNGAGVTRVVVRDALGREQTFESSYYLPANLLAPGMSEYSYTLGLRRQDVGRESWGYDTPVLVAQHRLGLRSWLTGALRFEGGTRLASGGPSVAFGLPFGEVTAAAAASFEGARAGAAASLGYGYSSLRYSFGLLARALTARYATISLDGEDERATLELGVSLGVPVAPRVSLTAQAQHLDERDHGRSDRLSITSSLQLSNAWQLALSTSGSRERGGSFGLAAFASLTMLIDQRTSASASQRVARAETGAEMGAETGFELQRTLPVATGYGYRLRGQLTKGGAERGDATLELQGEHGRYEANVSWDDQRASGRLGVAGGVVLIGGRAFATRPVQRGFALIRVPGFAGVRGYLDNHLIGTTDGRGDLVVPNLIPYYANRIAIDDTDLPMDTTAPITERLIASRSRSGVVVRFAAQRMRAARGSIVIDDGQRSAAYGELHLRNAAGDDEVFPIGSEGEFELANLPPGSHRAQLEYAGGSCIVALQISERGQPIEELGPLPCTQPTEARR